MYVQFSERFPGTVLDTDNERIFVDRRSCLDEPLEQLYSAYLGADPAFGALGLEYAAGFPVFLDAVSDLAERPLLVKGQVTGPVSWGLSVVDQDRRPVLYDDVLADALGRFLRLKATWQETELRKVCSETAVFVDEPYMASFGSAFVSLGRDLVIELLEEVFGGISGLKGAHCCGNTDWGLLLSTSVDILSFDTYEYAETLSLYPEDVQAFLNRGGVIAWGITPKTDVVWDENVESLTRRLEEAIRLLVDRGVSEEKLLEQGLVTPSCGVGTMEIESAERALDLTAAVAKEMQRRYVGDFGHELQRDEVTE
jgi:methionine synthase II (cobalamin-independent)